MNTSTRNKAVLLATAMVIITAASTRLKADIGTCGGASTTLPFTDVPASNIFFCVIAEAYFSGLTAGTTATTYSPGANVTREQMAAFITRTLDQSLKRGSKRAALRQFWVTQTADNLGRTSVGSFPRLVESDGADLWVANQGSNTVSRVRASDGKLLDTWTGATGAFGVLPAMGKVFVTGQRNPGALYQIDPAQAAGSVTTVSSTVGVNPLGIAFDGQRIWIANQGPPGGVSIVTLDPTGPPTVTTVTTGFSSCYGVIYDGANIWVTDGGDGKLKKLDSSGNIVLSISIGSLPLYPAFDGTNLWVPEFFSSSVTVVRAGGLFAGTVLATHTLNGLSNPQQAAFDGERILVANHLGGGVSLWKASDLTPIPVGFSTGSLGGPFGVCSDGVNFWITLFNEGKLARF
jgi:DNA-binding beta-propeller fold protein YncE